MDRRFQSIALALFIGIAIIRIVSTYHVFNATLDEGAHIAAGMEWLQNGTFFYQGEHPPLSRVALAIGPSLIGQRVVVARNITALIAGNIMLHEHGNYWNTLSAGRVGTLPFFVLACVVVFLWAARWFSVPAGLWAVLMFSSLPPVLGHAGLATIDVACAASVLLALYVFMRWIEEPSTLWSIYLGAAMAAAVLCKLSSIPFVGACVGAAMLYALIFRSSIFQQLNAQSLALRLAVIAGIGFFVLWAGYRFSLNPVSLNARMSIPLGQLISSIRSVALHNSVPNESYLLGKFATHGWWYFFPVALSVKTPIGFLLLAGAGFLLVLRGFRLASWQRCMTVAFPAAILTVCMAANLNMGVRHVLPIYPFLAIIAGHAISTLLERGPRPLAVVSVLLAGWMLVDSARAHPDYLAYFNEAGGGHPERILVSTDLDWGQDLYRLSLRMRELQAKELTVCYFGGEPVMMAGLPNPRPLDPKNLPHGYVAISLWVLYLQNAKDGSVAYFKTLTPKERIGKSIDLFYIP